MSVEVASGTSRGLYQALGYRVCGARAVRVDILERLADLIRAALAWKPGENSPAPQGAVDGRVFAVSENMTSLVGCAGEDFEAILRSLGYRSETRKGPLPLPYSGVASTSPVARAAAAEAAPAEPAPAEDARQRTPTAEPGTDAEAATPDEEGHEAPGIASSEQAVPEATEAEAEAQGEPPAEARPQQAEELVAPPETAEEAPAAEADRATDEMAAADTAADEAVLGSPEAGEQGPQHVAAPAEGAEPLAEAMVGEAQAAAAPEGEAAAAPEGEAAAPAEEEHVVWRPARTGRPNQQRRQGRGRQAPREGEAEAPAREGREGNGKGRPRDRQGPRKKGPPQRHKPEAAKAPPRREKEPDPDSPFAKLAALRDELSGRRR